MVNKAHQDQKLTGGHSGTSVPLVLILFLYMFNSAKESLLGFKCYPEHIKSNISC